MNIKPIIFCLLLFTFVSLIFVGCSDKIEVSADTVNSTIRVDKPVLKVFIENSGSMDGYMGDGAQLKDAVYDYVSELNRNTDSTCLYYINNAVIPYKGNLTSYVKDLNPAAFRAYGGNRSNTDLGEIITTVLGAVNDSTVVLFVSDCILDLPSKDATKFLNNCKIRIKDEIVNTRKRVPDLGIEVLKLSSIFNGNYYYPNGTCVTLKDVERPYYMWIFGDKNYLAALNSEVPLSLLAEYGLSGVATFTNMSEIPFSITNQGMLSSVIYSRNGEYQATIRADFRSTLQPEETIMNIGNYKFNNSNLTVEGIYPITDKESKYSYFINITLSGGSSIVSDRIVFAPQKIPVWVAESNDESGTNVLENIEKTTGIESLIKGVADAYRDEKGCAGMSFNVKKR